MKKILYTEDDKDIAEAVKIILTKAGFLIDIAYTGKECLEKSENGFDLYLLDIMLPDMSGWDIFMSLKEKGHKAKFSMISAIPVSSQRLNELKKAGLSDYIMKPFTKEELIDKVKRILDNGF